MADESRGVFLYPSGEVYAGQWLGLSHVVADDASESDSDERSPRSRSPRSDGPRSGRNSDLRSPRSDCAPLGTAGVSPGSKGGVHDSVEQAPCRHGWGVHLCTGDTYEGDWQDDKWHGLGCVNVKAGDRYVGQFAHGVRAGSGINISTDGQLQSEFWEAGTLLRKGPLFELPSEGDDAGLGRFVRIDSDSSSSSQDSDRCSDVSSGAASLMSDMELADIREVSGGDVSASVEVKGDSVPAAESSAVLGSAREDKADGCTAKPNDRSNLRSMSRWSKNEVAHLLSTIGLAFSSVAQLKAHRVSGSVLGTLSSCSAASFLRSTLGQGSEKQVVKIAVALFLKIRQRLAVPKLSVESVRQRFRDMEIEDGQLIFGHTIGEGGYGRVYKTRWMHTDVAAKVFRGSENGKISKDFVAELCVLRKLRHPNITLLIGFSFRPQCMIVTEYVQCGSLFDLLHRSQQQPDWNFSKVVGIAREICFGMSYMHFNGMVHCDLKSSNILISETQEVKICDFGLAHQLSDASLDSVNLGRVGTDHWMAPEVLRGEGYSKAADVYSFGMILWEMISRKVPYEGYTSVQVVGIVGFGRRRPHPPRGCPEPVRHVLRSALRPRPRSRRSFEELSEELRCLHRSAVIDVEEKLWAFFAG